MNVSVLEQVRIRMNNKYMLAELDDNSAFGYCCLIRCLRSQQTHINTEVIGKRNGTIQNFPIKNNFLK